MPVYNMMHDKRAAKWMLNQCQACGRRHGKVHSNNNALCPLTRLRTAALCAGAYFGQVLWSKGIE
jgi:hypothetical protein